VVVDADVRLLLTQPDHVRDDRLVVAAAEEIPGEQAADHEQQQQEQPEPPVALGRRAGRLCDLFLCNGCRRQHPADHLVDPARASTSPACAIDPLQPGGLPVCGQREEAVARLRDAIERRRNVGWKLSASGHRNPVCPCRQ